jgi:hypothetical protein
LLPASLVDISLRRHYDLELMESRKERWKELIINALRKALVLDDSADPNLLLTQ